MSIDTIVFNHTYDSIPWSQFEVRKGREVIERATSSGMVIQRIDTDYGIVNQVSGEIRFLKTDEFSRGLKIGDRIEARPDGGTWTEARVAGLYEQGGVVRMNLEAVNE